MNPRFSLMSIHKKSQITIPARSYIHLYCTLLQNDTVHNFHTPSFDSLFVPFSPRYLRNNINQSINITLINQYHTLIITYDLYITPNTTKTKKIQQQPNHKKMAANSVPFFEGLPQEKQYSSEEMTNDPNKARGTERAMEGPLAIITANSYIQGLKSFAIATCVATGIDWFLRTTPIGEKMFPRYRHVLGQYRFYGWTLACLGYYQYNVEDTQITSILKRNENAFHAEDRQDQMDYFRDMEAKKLKEEAKAMKLKAQQDQAAIIPAQVVSKNDV